MLYSFGLLLPSICLHFNTDRSGGALVSSILFLFQLGTAPAISAAITKIGHRNCALIGSVTAALGILGGGLSVKYMSPPSLPVFYFTTAVTGLGFGFLYLSAVSIIELYFNRHLGLAIGLATSGTGFGQLVLSQVIVRVEKELHLAYTLMFLAALVSLTLIASATYRYPNKMKTGDLTLEELAIEVPSLKTSYKTILKTPALLTFYFARFLTYLSSYATFVFTSDREIYSNGLSAKDTSYLIGIIGVSNLLGRIFFGKLLDAFRKKTFMLTSTVLLVNSLTILLSTYVTSFYGQAAFAVVFGFTIGAVSSSTMVTLKVISKDQVTNSLGIYMLVAASASLIGPKIVGEIFDAHQDYRIGFLVVGCLGLLGAAIFATIPCIIRTRQHI